jgi:hypothetical protein
MIPKIASDVFMSLDLKTISADLDSFEMPD